MLCDCSIKLSASNRFYCERVAAIFFRNLKQAIASYLRSQNSLKRQRRKWKRRDPIVQSPFSSVFVAPTHFSQQPCFLFFTCQPTNFGALLTCSRCEQEFIFCQDCSACRPSRGGNSSISIFIRIHSSSLFFAANQHLLFSPFFYTPYRTSLFDAIYICIDSLSFATSQQQRWVLNRSEIQQ